MTQRVKQKQRTRERLLDIAGQLFAEQGLAGTRTADVARAAGVAHGTVFAHFGTRERLLAEVVGRFGRRVAGTLRPDANATVAGVLETHLAGLERHEALYTRLVQESHLLPDAARAVLFGIQSALSRHLGAAAAREMAAGRLRGMPQSMIFNTWLGLLHHHLVNRDLFAPGGSVIAAKGPELLAWFIQLLKPETSTQQKGAE